MLQSYLGTQNHWSLLNALYHLNQDLEAIKQTQPQNDRNTNAYTQLQNILSPSCLTNTTPRIEPETIILLDTLSSILDQDPTVEEKELKQLTQEIQTLKESTDNPTAKDILNDIQQALILYPKTGYPILEQTLIKTTGKTLLYKNELKPNWQAYQAIIKRLYDLTLKAKPIIDMITSFQKLLGQ